MSSNTDYADGRFLADKQLAYNFAGLISGNLPCVLFDTPSADAPVWTNGYLRLSTPSTQPVAREALSIVGFSIRAHAAIVPISLGGQKAFGYPGDIWAGIMRDTNVQEGPNPTLPKDLTTFVKLFSGNDDSLGILRPDTIGPSGVSIPVPLGDAVMLPSSITILPGSQAKMALILTPSLLGGDGAAGPTISFVVLDADYTILFERNHE